MSDQRIASETFEDIQRSRALAAYMVHHLTACSPEDAAGSIVDGGDDNGLDAIYFHEPEETLYIVQSKWIKDGKGEPDNGSVKKFCSGFNATYDLKLSLNSKASFHFKGLNENRPNTDHARKIMATACHLLL